MRLKNTREEDIANLTYFLLTLHRTVDSSALLTDENHEYSRIRRRSGYNILPLRRCQEPQPPSESHNEGSHRTQFRDHSLFQSPQNPHCRYQESNRDYRTKKGDELLHLLFVHVLCGVG